MYFSNSNLTTIYDFTNFNLKLGIYKAITFTLNPSILLYFSLIFLAVSGASFAWILSEKIKNLREKQISPLPLASFPSVLSWLGSLLGLTIVFSSTLTVFAFPFLPSLIFSVLISFTLGFLMWKSIDDLMMQIDKGEVKEIDEFI